MGGGSLNDTIGLTFGSFEKEWGTQSQSRLACLSLVSTAGQILASVFVGHIGDLNGRTFVARYASLLIALCIGLCTVSPSLEVLALARFLGGLGYGSFNIVIPTLLSECVPIKSRYLLVLYQFGWPLGAGTFTYIMARYGWRIAMVAFLPGASVIFGMFWCPGCLPESPRWLCAQGKLKEASDAVAKFGDTSAFEENVGDESDVPRTEMSRDSIHSTVQSNVVQSFYICVAVSVLCVATASMLIKVWLPQVLAQRGVHSNTMAFVTMWGIEAAALVVSGALFSTPAKDRAAGSNSNLALLRFSQLSFIAAAFAVLGQFKARSAWLVTVFGVAHLLGQSNANNFLLAFATLSFPVAVRARCVAGLFLASYAGCFVGPLLGAILLQWTDPLVGAYSVLSMGSFIYICGYIGTLSLGKEHSNQ
jgi:MFS family permease